MKKVVVLVLSSLILFAPLANARGCKSFKTHAEAQKHYERTHDKSMDRDGDGSACDCLPGGSGKKCPKKKR